MRRTPRWPRRQDATDPYLEHCDECGAHLSTKSDQDLHAQWHQELFDTLVAIQRTAEHADSFNRLIG